MGDSPSFYYSPRWSPDSKKIAYTDKRHNVWILDIATGKSTRVDTNTYDTPFHSLNPAWSPDSRWLAYTKQLKSHLHAVFVYSVDKGQSHQITDGMSDARFAEFDKNVKYLYFTASTDAGPTTGWLDMSSHNRPVTRSVYVVVLGKDDPSPIAPESDEEANNEPVLLQPPPPGSSPSSPPRLQPQQQEKPDKQKGKDTKEKGDKEKNKDKVPSVPVPYKPGSSEPTALPLYDRYYPGPEPPIVNPTKTDIDFDRIDQRILALPITARNYVGLAAGSTGQLFSDCCYPLR